MITKPFRQYIKKIIFSSLRILWSLLPCVFSVIQLCGSLDFLYADYSFYHSLKQNVFFIKSCLNYNIKDY